LTQTLWANAWAPSNADKYSTDAEALRSIRRAIAIAPAMPLGYSALGLVYFNQLMLKPSLEALSRSVQLAGADSLAFLNYSVILCRLRRQAEAEAAAERAISVDPLNATAWQIKTWTLFLGRRYPQSIDAARQTLSIAPENRRARTLLAWDLLFLGRTDEAVSELQHVPADDYRRFVAEGAMAARSNRREDALRAIQGLEKRYGDTVHYQLAEIYAQLGDGDKAVANLEAAWLVRDSGLATLQVDPFLDPVRNDPRFSKIAARLFG
jgi:tetratricopeptide (TPR) repeat protein